MTLVLIIYRSQVDPGSKSEKEDHLQFGGFSEIPEHPQYGLEIQFRKQH